MTKKDGLQVMELDDMYNLENLQEACLGPDGKTVVYVVSHVDKATETETASLWLLTLDTGRTKRLTWGQEKDMNPAWSPDGKQIAYLSSLLENSQIYVVPVEGGKAWQLTSLQQGVASGPVWSPDGKAIAFSARSNKPARDPRRPYRITRHIYRYDGLGYLDDEAQSIFVISVATGELKQLTKDECHNTSPLWSPDGLDILYLSQFAPHSHAIFRAVKIANLHGEIQEVIQNIGYGQTANWMPDGERIVFTGTAEDRVYQSKYDLWVINRDGSNPQCRTAGLKMGVNGVMQGDSPSIWIFQDVPVQVSSDGAKAFINVQDGGLRYIYEVALKGPESWHPIVTGKDRTTWLLDSDDHHLLFAVSTYNDPANLFISELDGSDEKQLTHINQEFLSEIDLPEIEHLEFKGSDGEPVEGWFLKPTGGKAPYPTVLYIHGGPFVGMGYLFGFDYHVLAGAGYAVLMINQRGSSGYGDGFSTKILNDWGHLDYEDLMAGVNHAIEKGLVDPSRMGVCGLSGGGYLSCWIIGHTDRFKAAVPENPVTNWFSMYGVSDIGPYFSTVEVGGKPHEVYETYKTTSPVTYAHHCKTPTLLLVGERDYRCPAEEAEQFYSVLKANNCIVEMVRFPASSHLESVIGSPIIRRAQTEALRDWMKAYV
jgi:dipeptidyl aminopeptidase/acylaminoacyl peptidase